MIRNALLSLLVGAIGLSACSSPNFVVGHPTKKAQFVRVVANVEGARAQSEYGNRCTTPCNLPLLADRGGTVTISADGFASQRHRIGSQFLLVEPPPPTIGGSVMTGSRGSGVSIGGSISPGGVREVAVLDRGLLFVELEPLAEGERDPLGPDEITSGKRMSLEEYEARRR